MATIQGIYVALFGRPADPLGLAYFNEVTNDGADLTAIGDLAGTAEYQDRFEGMSNAQIVTAIYQSLFGRNPELAGLEYFVNELNSGRQTINTVAINILDGAQGADAEIVANKEAAANLFTAAIAADADALARYDGATGIEAGVSFLSGITADEATVPTQAQVEAFVEAFGQGQTGIGEEYTLTQGLDRLDGTADNDTFDALPLNATTGAAATTLNSFDVIDGGAGIDTLNIFTATGGDAGYNTVQQGTVRNVEIINIHNAEGAVFGAAAEGGVNAAGFQGSQQIWQIGNAGNISGLVNGQTAGFRGTDANAGAAPYVVAAAAAATAVSIALDEAGAETEEGNAEVALAVSGARVTTLNVSGTVADDGRLSFTSLPEGIETVNLALDSDTQIGLYADAVDNFASVETLNASASTGDLTTVFGRFDDDDDFIAIPELALETVTLGSGNDTVALSIESLTADEVAIDLGAGADELMLLGGNEAGVAVNVTLGAGADVLRISVNNVADIEDLDASLITITDFNADADLLDVGVPLLFFTAANAVTAALETLDDDATLADAIEAVAASLDFTGAAIINFGEDTYIYADSGEDGLSEGDMLVAFTGGVEFDSSNFTNGIWA